MKISKLIIFIIFFGTLFIILSKLPHKKISLDDLANVVVRKCRNAPDATVCYESEIPRLMKFLSMEETFEVTTIVQSKDQNLFYCHVLGHKIASVETSKDPSKWKDVITRCPFGVCSNGCVHGAFQERYRDEYLSGSELDEAKNEFETICEKRDGFNPTGLEKGGCYHALGHLLMYVTNGDANKSVAICEDVAKKEDQDFSPQCYAGAFMQIFQPLESDDIALVQKLNVTPENAWDFCSRFPQKLACWKEAWPMFLDKLMKPESLIDFCSSFKGSDKNDCISNFFYLMPVEYQFNLENVKKYCEGFDGGFRNSCFSMSAARLLEIDKRNIDLTVGFCNSLNDKDRSSCLDSLIEHAKFDFHKDSLEYKQLCSLLDNPWQQKCEK